MASLWKGAIQMKFEAIAADLEGIPYTQRDRGKKLYEHILETRPEHCLELGFAHGVATCYIAAALSELGAGHLTCVDLESSEGLEPNLETLLERNGLSEWVTIRREPNSYTWYLKKLIENHSKDGGCVPYLDFCFIDGPKNWTVDGMAFFCVDKLLRRDGYILFDDYQWRYDDYSKDALDGITIRDLSRDQRESANIELVFKLLVMQHPAYSNFVIDDDWAWAQKRQAEVKTVRYESSQSIRYKVMKAFRRLRGSG